MHRPYGRAWQVLLLACLVVTSGVSVVWAQEPSSVQAERIGGDTRYDTAVLTSQATFGGVRDIWLARGDDFPDALAASYPSGRYNDGGPILLTPSDRLHPAVRTEIERLGSNRVFLLGGTAAISPGVREELEEMGVQNVSRAGGTDRYRTARVVAALAPEDHFGVAYLATGRDFADALAAGPSAYLMNRPILLTTPDRLHTEAREAFGDLDIREVILLGGERAISDHVRRDIEDLGLTVSRIGGRDRTETAALLATEFVESGGAFIGEGERPVDPPIHVNLARGDLFPDALAAGPHGGEEHAPLLLTASPTKLGEATRAWLESHAETIETIHVLGTADAISDAVVKEARRAAGG